MKTFFGSAAFCAVLLSSGLSSCGTQPQNTGSSEANAGAAETRIRTEPASFDLGGESSQSTVAYDEAAEGKRPVVLVLPEWWGLTEYPKNRAKQFAEMGYFAMAVDLYGAGQVAPTPDSAGALAGAFYADPQMAKARIDAALAKARTYPQADPSRVVLVGYCFGGGLALNAARLGGDYTAVVSFHGSLKGVPAAPGKTKARIFVAHGAADSFVPAADVAQFKKEMEAANTAYTFKQYEGATHAFTNPGADENARKFGMPIAYNAAADSASWTDMQAFLAEIL